MTLVNGLRADYTPLFENRSRVALHYTRDATNYARPLLAICGDCYDAYIATGISRYLIGSMSPPLRWILRMGGFSGDKKQGMVELRSVLSIRRQPRNTGSHLRRLPGRDRAAGRAGYRFTEARGLRSAFGSGKAP